MSNAGIAWGDSRHPITLAIITGRTVTAYEHYPVSELGIVTAFIDLSNTLHEQRPANIIAESGGIGGLAYARYLPKRTRTVRPHDDHLTKTILAIEDGNLTLPPAVKPLIRFSYAILAIALAYIAVEENNAF